MDTIHLIGAEDVRQAGNTMSSAAREMRSAASQIDDSLSAHARFLTDWLQEFKDIMEQALTETKEPT